MALDGRYYGAALPIPPVQYHPGAQAVGELAAGGLRAAYFYAQHQATLIGSQTWPMRHRRAAAPVTLSSTSMQRVAEWVAVHLAEHHTHCLAEFWWASPQVAGPRDVLVRVVTVDGQGDTATGSTLTTTVQPESEGLLIAGQRAYVSQVAVDISSLTRPTAAGRIYVEAYAVLGGSIHIAPLQATAWRVTVP